jgi:hypothetical protein
MNFRINAETHHQIKLQALMERIQLGEFVEKLFRCYMRRKVGSAALQKYNYIGAQELEREISLGRRSISDLTASRESKRRIS